MNQACVSLDEVLAAAGARAASLVPETSGYLALAVADATSRLPYVHDDRAVLLTIDGSVMVPKKPGLTTPPEAGRGLRDLLRRLLAASTGSMPGLTSAARVRSEEQDVERVVGDIEAALIPVNRAAAKRALARLARETLRAKEMGKLKKKSAPPPAPAVTASVKVPPAQIAQIPAKKEAIPAKVIAPPAPPALVVTPPPAIAAELALVERVPVIAPPALVVMPRATTPAPVEVDVEMSPEPAPLRAVNAWGDNDATIADPDAMAVIEASYREVEHALEAPDLDAQDDAHAAEASPIKDDDSLTRPWQRQVVREKVVPEALTAGDAPTALTSQLTSSRADELLGAFRAEDEGDPAVLAAASSLRELTGVDEPSPLEPVTQRPSYLRPPPPARRAQASRHDADDELPLPQPRSKTAAPTRWPLALFALGVLVLFAAWLYRPTLAHDFFGLRKLVGSPKAEPAAAPAPSDETAPSPAIDAPPAVPLRARDARASAGSGDGSHRRRD